MVTKAWPFEMRPLPDATFGAVVTGLRLAELDDAAFAALYAAWLDYALLIFPGQHLTATEQIAFARRFGAAGVRDRADQQRARRRLACAPKTTATM